VEPRDDIFFVVESAGVERYGVHHREWKLVREVSRSGAARNHLFHIEEDPTESSDLSEKNPKLVADLVGRIEEWRKFHPADGVREANAPPPGFQSPKLWVEAAREG
jgi:hypothetical protein